MYKTLLSTLALATLASAQANSASITPHTQFSSSIGVLGCMIDVNRVAYFPSFPPCTSMCLKVSYGSQSVNLLHIDQSGGAFDISYDAWVFLQTGESARQDPIEGGGIPATYETVDMSQCQSLIQSPDGKLPLMAANSMNFVASCLAQPDSYVAQNYGLWNIATSACTYGVDEECSLDMAVSNQPTCPHQLGIQTPLTNMPVFNIEYGTGKEVLAT
ncbi:MAG: hypothetical protein GOMPHAMPRED_008280 [Gomphillus americanus]|uniref:Cerato-platanin n=1 Tax=Gomphillus americanus TaxID=1940652 RepID=A0A8H3EYD0_9LECA|nr:MAG: hypothetical protein GOMPHAMPRED_008280 [Gomphillus americanus]